MILKLLGLFGLTTTQHAEQRFSDGYWKRNDHQTESKKLTDMFQLEQLVNKPIIGISNEWEDPLIGTVVGIELITQAKNPVPIVRCAITGREHIALCVVMPFTLQRFKAVMKLTPYERWCLMDKHGDKEYRDGSDPKLPKLSTEKELLDILNRRGFAPVFQEVHANY